VDQYGNQTSLAVIDNGNGTMSFTAAVADNNNHGWYPIRTFYVKVPLLLTGGSTPNAY
jgi:hypothetical protein